MDESLRRDAWRARAELRSGALRGPALVERLLCVPSRDRDVWADELLDLPEPPPEDVSALPPGAVPYLPAGVEEILTMVREAPLRPDDQLVDLGSGLGRVVMLAHLLSGARALGVEIQKPLVQYAAACSGNLGLGGLSFVHADAAETELDGSVFFLYSPFNGETLARVMRRLEAVARRRPIVLCAVDLELPSERWLQRRGTSTPSLTLYDSRAPGDAGR
ncbi:MAG TPA: class I SAM-dependent methyltransferase [Myxococcales bacterium]|nr:class I SAM-dependent methyltransferase [Myxococcales bacterium]